MTVATSKPTALEVRPESIPAELRDIPRWVGWRYAWAVNGQGIGKWTKPPHRIDTPDLHASSTDPGTWAVFEDAEAAYQRGTFDGIGLCQDVGDDLVGIDLDHCVDPATDEIATWAQQVIEDVDSYTERSPGSDGIRIMVRGTLPERDRKNGDAEIYGKDRYLTITGWVVDGRDTIRENGPAILRFHAKYVARPRRREASPRPAPPPPLASDADLLTKARAAKNGSAFASLFDGVPVTVPRAKLTLLWHRTSCTGLTGISPPWTACSGVRR